MSETPRANNAPQLLAEFVDAEVLAKTDVHVATPIAEMIATADERVVLAIAMTIAATRSGSVCLDVATAHDAFPGSPGAEVKWPETSEWLRAVASALPAEASSPLVLEGTRLYLEKYWRHENHLAGQITRRAAQEPDRERDIEDELLRLFPEPAIDPTLDAAAGEDRQLLAARTAATRNLTVIAGGPGTGKTTTIARIFALLVQLGSTDTGHPHVALAAPTGRASARLKEALLQRAATIGADDDVRALMRSVRPTTLHKLLGYRPGNRYRHDAYNPVPCDAVIVDESSMVSLSMMDRLLSAIPPASKAILVGDPQQLASVDAGSAFGDIVSAYGDGRGAKGVVMLSRVHRYGIEIGSVAESILSGDVAAVEEQLTKNNGDVVEWVAQSPLEMTSGDRIDVLQSATTSWESMRDLARQGQAYEAAQLIESARILCGHRFGPYGVRDWNLHAYTAVFGRPSHFNASDGWFAGRPILVQQNDYQLDIFNGDSGVVVDSAEGSQSVVFDRSQDIFQVPTSRLASVQTAFASTVHKSQGSQFRNVIVILPPPESRLMTRELLYTAVTRAQGRVTIVGTSESLAAAVTTGSVRQSGLRDRLAR